MPRPDMRRAVIVFPNGFTLANLFFGIFAIVAASRGNYSVAGLYVVLGGVADGLDGRVARATRTGTRFGSELDSLVDAVSFGLAPALIMYFAVLNREGWDWIFVFFFSACACIRLARFNIEQAGRSKTHFNGLPSPAAGMTLATYYWFSQTPLYTETMIGNLPWHVMLRFVMLGLSFLMISSVSYPAMPTIGLHSTRAIAGTVIVLALVLGLIFLPKQFFFPCLLGYVTYGLASTVIEGLLERRVSPVEPSDGPEFDRSPPDVATIEERAAETRPSGGTAGRRRRRRRRPSSDRGPGAPGPAREPGT